MWGGPATDAPEQPQGSLPRTNAPLATTITTLPQPMPMSSMSMNERIRTAQQMLVSPGWPTTDAHAQYRHHHNHHQQQQQQPVPTGSAGTRPREAPQQRGGAAARRGRGRGAMAPRGGGRGARGAGPGRVPAGRGGAHGEGGSRATAGPGRGCRARGSGRAAARGVGMMMVTMATPRQQYARQGDQRGAGRGRPTGGPYPVAATSTGGVGSTTDSRARAGPAAVITGPAVASNVETTGNYAGTSTTINNTRAGIMAARIKRGVIVGGVNRGGVVKAAVGGCGARVAPGVRRIMNNQLKRARKEAKLGKITSRKDIVGDPTQVPSCLPRNDKWQLACLIVKRENLQKKILQQNTTGNSAKIRRNIQVVEANIRTMMQKAAQMSSLNGMPNSQDDSCLSSQTARNINKDYSYWTKNINGEDDTAFEGKDAPIHIKSQLSLLFKKAFQFPRLVLYDAAHSDASFFINNHISLADDVLYIVCGSRLQVEQFSSFTSSSTRPLPNVTFLLTTAWDFECPYELLAAFGTLLVVTARPMYCVTSSPFLSEGTNFLPLMYIDSQHASSSPVMKKVFESHPDMNSCFKHSVSSNDIEEFIEECIEHTTTLQQQ
ncbi:hypothetical protein Pelo_9588 [Pelomyxa schiedti]|nr:hypothetical protein Pelo_9588 [Pelomyxa schiedti]